MDPSWGGRVRERPRDRVAEARDRLAATDPGLVRLRSALGAAVAMGSALAVEAGVARLLGADPSSALASMLLGAVVAMMGSNALVGPEVWAKVRNAAFFPVAVGAGMVTGTLTSSHADLRVVGFVVVGFVAVFVRRFGPAWFFYGFMGWMGYFFASFLRATPAMVPDLLIAVVVATVWVLLLSVTVFRTNPRSALEATLRAFAARTRTVARECADLLGVHDRSGATQRRAVRALSARQAGLAEAALFAEAWSEDVRSLPPGWSGPAVRRRLIESQQAVDRIAGASLQLAVDDTDPGLLVESVRLVSHVANRRERPARAAAERLDVLAAAVEGAGGEGWWPARHLAFGCRELLDLTTREAHPPEVDPVEEGFEATTQLVFGQLPGAPAIAREVPVRGSRRNPLTHLDMPSRQAVQVALAGLIAIVVGSQLSPTRYFWAVIATFVTFTGTGTRSETFLKGLNRVLGTLAGLFAAILLAHVTAGHTPAVLATILVSVFLGFYLILVSYVFMIFFITIMLGQLYTVLGTFSDALLVLRLEETAIGAAAGVGVALLIAPLSTRDTARSARNELLTAMAALLDGVASYAEGRHPDLDALSRALDDRSRRLQLVAAPLARPLTGGSGGPRTRHRLRLVVAAVAQARALTVALRRRPVQDAEGTAAGARALAEVCRSVTSGPPSPGHRDLGSLPEEDPVLSAERGVSRDRDPVHRHLAHLTATLTEMAEGRTG